MMEDGRRRLEKGYLDGKILRLHKLHEDFQGLERN